MDFLREALGDNIYSLSSKSSKLILIYEYIIKVYTK